MSTRSMIVGKALAGLIVCTPEPMMSNAIVSTVGEASPAAHSPIIAPEAVFALAAVIASRRVQAPSSATVSAVLLTVIVLAKAPWVRRSRPTATDTLTISEGGRSGSWRHRHGAPRRPEAGTVIR